MTEVVRTLVVDDEERIRLTLGETLRRAGHVVVTASSGEEALDLLRETSFDVAVVDLSLGGRIDGLRVLEAARWRWPGMALVILTGHGSLESAITAIREGVDDYLLKPAKPAEVRQAVQEALDRRKALAQSREGAPRGGEQRRVVQCGGFFVDLEQHLAALDGRPLKLTPQEFKLLVHLMQNAPRVIPPLELVQVVRDYEPEYLPEARQIIKWYIHRLRRQVEPDPSNPRHILNVRGVGYKFKE
jgi:DNA-binding response OmpR family regulator